ncbi:class I SAM-dependent methyltransferase [Candidatus Woesearchaeota archaeon]|nr:class I SAM-dependent methyltransferase [Candidatus Woesearchaeota archaeon]
MKEKNRTLSDKKIEQNITLFDRWAKTYDKPLFQFWMRKFYQPALKLIDSGKVLDVSCGTGEFLRELDKKKKKITLYGIDLSSHMIAKARTKLGKKINMQTADVHQLPFPEDSFDYVVSTESFHHYYDQSKALAEMKRVAKKGGTIVIVDINFFLKPIHWLFEKFEPGCVKVNSRKEMRDLFRKVGLHNIIQFRSFIFSVLTTGVKNENK